MPRVRVAKSELWKAIREHCTECCGGSWKERQNCPVTDCPLHPFRNGTASDCDTTAEPNDLD